MGKIIDLSILEKEPLIFKGLDGEKYTIPGNISTKFTIKLTHYQQQMQKIKKDEEALEKIKELVVDILNLDKSKNVDMEYLDKHFDDIRVLKLIIQKMIEHIQEITADPNSNSLESTEV